MIVDIDMQDHLDARDPQRRAIKSAPCLVFRLRWYPFPGIYLRFNEQLLAEDKQYIILMQEIPVVEGLAKKGLCFL